MLLYTNFAKDENGNHILDENENKIEYSVEYQETDEWYKPKEPIHVNEDGHLVTEDRHLVVKDGVANNHAVSKGQLEVVIAGANENVKQLITTAMNSLKTQIMRSIMEVRNEQVKNRIGIKPMKLPKNYTWIKLLDTAEIDGITKINELVVLGVNIKRTDRYHFSHSDLVHDSFTQLELFYDETAYYMYFNAHPRNYFGT